jgi:hypothetical protein
MSKNNPIGIKKRKMDLSQKRELEQKFSIRNTQQMKFLQQKAHTHKHRLNLKPHVLIITAQIVQK